MSAIDIIRKKRDGGELNAVELQAFVRAATDGSWRDYQLTALLMAIVLRGMTDDETAQFTRCMVESGKTFNLNAIPGIKVDKHSTGGVGDKVSLVLAPLAAACGVKVPMMSGRGLGHTGGTLDKLEAIPGFRVQLSEAEFLVALQAVGCAMLGQTAEVAPADKTLYALRDVSGTVESIPLITASILSKKIAEGISALVMDVKCGRGAFMKSLPEARALARTIQQVGRANGLQIETLITNMDAPLGRAVGNALEVRECLAVLQGHGPADLTELCLIQATLMVQLAGLEASTEAARHRVQAALQNGQALKKFEQMVAHQGGESSKMKFDADRSVLRSNASGYVDDMDAMAVGLAAMKLGAGREQADERIDPAVGIVVLKKPGEVVASGDAIYELHHRGERGLSQALTMLGASYRIGPTNPDLPPLVLETLT